MKLFDDDDNGGFSAEEDISKIEINKDFARKYEHNKKREDLMRLDELKKQGCAGVDDDDMSSSDESDSGDIEVSDFLGALLKVKNQDPVLRQKNIRLFDKKENEPEELGLGKRGKKKQKPTMYLKDVLADQLLKGGPEFDDSQEVKSYEEEQKGLRSGLVAATEKAMNEVADDGDLFTVKEHEAFDNDDDDVTEVGKKLDEYFGKDDNLDENEVFLKKYFRKKLWVGDDKAVRVEGEDGVELSDDEEAVEDQEDYEREFNFRHTENSGDRVLGHSRVVEGSVRNKKNPRKLGRERKTEREEQAERERKEELKRLKNVKKKEMREKLMKIKETAGVEGDWVCPLDEDDLEGEFDPEEHDRKMKDAFNDAYYGAEDVDPEFGSDADEDGEIEKPDFGKEDELLGLGKGWDEVSGSKDGFLAAREKFLKRKEENDGDEKEEKEGEEEEGNEDVVKEGKRKRKRKMSKMEKELLDKELEEYYKLDYEDTIGDLKTRFKYRGVPSKRYGLSTKEILKLDDKELNQIVSLKKIATYREKEWKVDRKKVLTQKQLLLKGEKLDDQINDGNKKLKIEDNKSEDEENKGGTSELSRKERKKRRQVELKIPNSRLAAYGKTPSKSKSKKKN